MALLAAQNWRRTAGDDFLYNGYLLGIQLELQQVNQGNSAFGKVDLHGQKYVPNRPVNSVKEFVRKFMLSALFGIVSFALELCSAILKTSNISSLKSDIYNASSRPTFQVLNPESTRLDKQPRRLEHRSGFYGKLMLDDCLLAACLSAVAEQLQIASPAFWSTAAD